MIIKILINRQVIVLILMAHFTKSDENRFLAYQNNSNKQKIFLVYSSNEKWTLGKGMFALAKLYAYCDMYCNSVIFFIHL